jgi:membrane protease YdiL (CAAX protease family)
VIGVGLHKSSATKISLGDAGLVIAICFGWFIALSIEAVVLGFPSSASFSDASLMSIVALECAFASAALMLLHYRGYALATLLPTPSWRGSIVGALLYVGTLGIWSVAALALFNDENSTQPIAKILANATPSLLVVVLLSMVNGLYEEAFLLGYLLRGLTPYGASFALGTSMLVRVLYHLYQGPVGTVSVLIFGLVVSIYYYRTRALWPTVVAHALGDFVALT